MLENNSLPADLVTAAAATTTTLLLRYLGISAPSGSSDVAGAMVTDTGVEIIRDGSLPSAVAKAKYDKAVEEASQNFLQEYVTAMAAHRGVNGLPNSQQVDNLWLLLLVCPKKPSPIFTNISSRLILHTHRRL